MKKYIQAELLSLAHKILQLSDDVDYTDLAIKASDLHEKLTILAYVEKFENTPEPTISLKDLEAKMMQTHTKEISTLEQGLSNLQNSNPEKNSINSASESQIYKLDVDTNENDHHRPDGTQFNEESPVHEPVIEKIKDMWPEMNPEASAIDKVIDSILPNQPNVGKNDSFEIGNEYHQTPIFEPKESRQETFTEKKSKNLNDSLKKGKFKIGLNDKLAFIKHLFNGSTADYNRVLSQLETFQSFDEAQQFIEQMVKLDYDNWEGKEMQEERFIQIIESRYA